MEREGEISELEGHRKIPAPVNLPTYVHTYSMYLIAYGLRTNGGHLTVAMDRDIASDGSSIHHPQNNIADRRLKKQSNTCRVEIKTVRYM